MKRLMSQQLELYYSDDSGGALARTISTANRRSIPMSPHLSASNLPSSSTSIARAILPLPSSTPALRKIRA